MYFGTSCLHALSGRSAARPHDFDPQDFACPFQLALQSVIRRFRLRDETGPQTYALGLKEVWEVRAVVCSLHALLITNHVFLHPDTIVPIAATC
jgi:hypothetical protein